MRIHMGLGDLLMGMIAGTSLGTSLLKHSTTSQPPRHNMVQAPILKSTNSNILDSIVMGPRSNQSHPNLMYRNLLKNTT